MTKLKIPNIFQSASYEKDVSDSLKKATESMFKTRKGLYLWGASGCGKSHAAYAIARYIDEVKDAQVMVFKSADILEMMKQDMDIKNSDKETNGDLYFGESNFLKGIKDYKGILVIDDLGVTKETEWEIQTFYQIIDRKYEDMIPTIITSNLGLDEISKKMGDRIASRIAGMCQVFEMTGKDKRVSP